MNFSKVMVLPLLMSGVVSVASAGSYINNYGEYSKTHEQVRPVVVSHSDSVSKRSGYDDMSVRFFMGLDAALFQYDNVRASADGYRERDYDIKINHKILENTGLSFGADINDGYKVYLLLNHYNNKVKVNGDSTNASQTNLGLALDIPVLKQESITPFIRVGLEYTWVDVKDSNHMKGHGLGYMAGVGLSHNFTDNIYGNVYLTYEFAHPDVKVSGTDLSYKQDALVLGLGLGYRF
jgi:opacity protein-like surface antigen